jgi:hypothetical protein
MMRKTVKTMWFYLLAAIGWLLVAVRVPPASGGQNDVPEGAGQAVVEEPGKRPTWFIGKLNQAGDVDWYWFAVDKPIKLSVAFEKPSSRSFFCNLYSGEDTEQPITEVTATERGEEFAGYTTEGVDPGKYYLKIWGAPGDFTADPSETYYYALSERPPGEGAKSREQAKPDEEKENPPQEQPSSPEEQEMKPDDVERLLNAFLDEEEDQREIKPPQEMREVPEVLRDW